MKPYNRTMSVLKELDKDLNDVKANHERVIHSIRFIKRHLSVKTLKPMFRELKHGRAIEALLNDPYFTEH